MKYHTVIQREGELLGPVDWTYDFRQHFGSMCSPDSVKDQYCERAKDLLRQIEPDPTNWEARFSHSDRAWRLIAVGMYDGWPFWKPTPAVLRNGPLGAEWEFFYSLCAIERVRKADGEGNETD